MNKFAAILLLAFAAAQLVAAAEITEDVAEIEALEADSLFSIVPDNDEEISYLTGAKVAFSDFCISSRDYIVADIKTITNKATANVFSLLFGSAEEISLAAIGVEKDASDRLGAQLRDPSSPIEGPHGENDVVYETQQKIQQNGGVAPQYFFESVVSALRASANVVTTRVAEKLDALKAAYANKSALPNAALTSVQSICEKVANYEVELDSQFGEAKNELAKAKPELKDVELKDVECVTSSRILRIGGMCEFAAVSKNPIVKMFNGVKRQPQQN